MQIVILPIVACGASYVVMIGTGVADFSAMPVIRHGVVGIHAVMALLNAMRNHLVILDSAGEMNRFVCQMNSCVLFRSSQIYLDVYIRQYKQNAMKQQDS